MQEFIPINIVVGDRTYRIRVQPGDEESLRKLSKQINDKILEFKTNFAGKDMQDYISMVLIWYATDVTSTNAKGSIGTDESAAADALKKLELQIDQLLQQG
jgi:cell division protein ZapA (FtsZ GTPase activity inhibitor)